MICFRQFWRSFIFYFFGVIWFIMLIIYCQSNEEGFRYNMSMKENSLIFSNTTKNNDKIYKKKECGKLPDISEIRFSNTHWQELDISNGMFYLYGSYLDNRRGNTDGPSIRIIGLRNSSLPPQINLQCLVWFNTQKTKPSVSRVIEQPMFNFTVEVGKLQPYLLTCQLPKTHLKKVSMSVSIVTTNYCYIATNNMKVIYNKVEKKKEFAVCVKGLRFTIDDYLVRLIEWTELISLLGADKIFFYQYGLHPNIKKALHLYVDKGIVELSDFSTPNGSNPDGVNRPHEIIPWNDCLYRNLYRYKYVVVMDTDEVIVPKSNGNWSDLMQSLEKQSLKKYNNISSTFKFRNVYFLDDMLDSHLKSGNKSSEDIILHRDILQIPEYMHMLRHVIRSKTFDGQHSKSIHNTDRVLLVHSHSAIKCLESECNSNTVSQEIAQVQHYRKTCQANYSEKYCYEKFKRLTIQDTTIWRYKKQIIDRVSRSLLTLGFKDPKKVL
jgi:hypothetical protein